MVVMIGVGVAEVVDGSAEEAVGISVDSWAKASVKSKLTSAAMISLLVCMLLMFLLDNPTFPITILKASKISYFGIPNRR